SENEGGGLSAEGLPADEIRFDGVTFGYPGGSLVLDSLDLVIPAGRSLAIVGENGAGKTTLVKLLCRMYEPALGRIEVDGIDIASLDVTAWRRRLAAVFQDSVRFELSAAVNIAYGRVDVADDAAGMEAAAVDAGIDDAIVALPKGFATLLSSEYPGGADLS